MKLFWVDKGWSSIIKDNELGYLSKDDRYDNPSGKTSHKEKHSEKENINRPIIAQLNINSVRNKFNFLESEARYITDIWDKNWWVISLGTIFARWIL